MSDLRMGAERTLEHFASAWEPALWRKSTPAAACPAAPARIAEAGAFFAGRAPIRDARAGAIHCFQA
jgi:hypothetical protein